MFNPFEEMKHGLDNQETEKEDKPSEAPEPVEEPTENVEKPKPKIKKGFVLKALALTAVTSFVVWNWIIPTGGETKSLPFVETQAQAQDTNQKVDVKKEVENDFQKAEGLWGNQANLEGYTPTSEALVATSSTTILFSLKDGKTCYIYSFQQGSRSDIKKDRSGSACTKDTMDRYQKDLLLQVSAEQNKQVYPQLVEEAQWVAKGVSLNPQNLNDIALEDGYTLEKNSEGNLTLKVVNTQGCAYVEIDIDTYSQSKPQAC